MGVLVAESLAGQSEQARHGNGAFLGLDKVNGLLGNACGLGLLRGGNLLWQGEDSPVRHKSVILGPGALNHLQVALNKLRANPHGRVNLKAHLDVVVRRNGQGHLDDLRLNVVNHPGVLESQLMGQLQILSEQLYLLLPCQEAVFEHHNIAEGIHAGGCYIVFGHPIEPLGHILLFHSGITPSHRHLFSNQFDALGTGLGSLPDTTLQIQLADIIGKLIAIQRYACFHHRCSLLNP